MGRLSGLYLTTGQIVCCPFRSSLFSCLWISILIFLLYRTTADGLSNPSMSNLVLKGIVGTYAMSKINRALEPQGTLTNYTQYYLVSHSSRLSCIWYLFWPPYYRPKQHNTSKTGKAWRSNLTISRQVMGIKRHGVWYTICLHQSCSILGLLATRYGISSSLHFRVWCV